jgi:hypothetical protein
MAKLVADPRMLPDRTAALPAVKPPVSSLPYSDVGHPEEVDTFREFIRQLRRLDRSNVFSKK